MLKFKADILAAHVARPAATYRAVPTGRCQDGPKALRQHSFDPLIPTAWSAEGLLPYLPAADRNLLFERVAELSAAGSRVAAEGFGRGFFDPEYMARRRERLRGDDDAVGE